jgi:hypothetical protein
MMSTTMLETCKGLINEEEEEEAFSPDTWPAKLHLTANYQQPTNQAVHVVITDIVMSS